MQDFTRTVLPSSNAKAGMLITIPSLGEKFPITSYKKGTVKYLGNSLFLTYS